MDRFSAACVLVAVLTASALVSSACTRDDGAERELATTTLPDGVDPWEVSPDIATESAEDLLARLDAAAADRDLCELIAVFESGLPFFDDTEGVVEVYDRLAVVVVEAEEWTPDELRDDWDPIAGTIVAGAAVVEEVEGDLTSSGVAATFGGDDFQRSVITAVRWARKNCPLDGAQS